MRELLFAYRRYFYAVGLFSFFVNLLQLAPSFYWMAVFDRVMTSRSVPTLFYLTLGVLGALAIIMFLEVLRSRLLVVITIWIDKKIAPRVFDALVLRAGRPDQPAYPEGMRDLYVLRSFVTGPGVFAFFDAPWLPIYVVIIFLFSPWLGMFLLLGALLMFIVGFINEKLSRDALDRMHREMAVASRFADGAARNAESVISLGMLSNIRQRWDVLNTISLSHQTATANVVGASLSLTRFVRQLIQIGLLCVGVWLVLEQDTSSGVMIAATFIASRALAPVEMLLSSWAQFSEARAAYHRLDAFLGRDSGPQFPRVDLAPPVGHVTVERLVFTVPGAPQPILKGFGFAVTAGEQIGIIGPSGSGKSTLARMLVGLWRPTTGSVRFDGAELDQWDRETLGKLVGYVPQMIELFPGSIAENIARMENLHQAMSDERRSAINEGVIRAARRAGVHELIVRLPAGYDTSVTEAGYSLSGGQRQRIALARALFGEPRIVVLDEPNSNLDAEGDAGLQTVLAELKAAGVTTFVVAHRPSVLANVDRLLVLREGMIEAFGTRQEVMGRYIPATAGGAA